jgi:hypothetical protein
MTTELNGKQVAIRFTEGVEQVELVKPLEALTWASSATVRGR